jgi:hypothetical protein
VRGNAAVVVTFVAVAVAETPLSVVVVVTVAAAVVAAVNPTITTAATYIGTTFT